MFGRGNRRLLALFESRFQADAGGYLFRSKPMRPAVRVTKVELEESIERYRRGSRWQSIGLTTVLIVMILVKVFVDTALHRRAADWETWALTTGLITSFTFRWYWLWNAPTREFAGRPEVGPPLSRSEARTRALSQISWLQFGMVGFAVVVLSANKIFDAHLALSWRIAWTLFGAAAIIVIGYRAIEKWTLSRRS